MYRRVRRFFKTKRGKRVALAGALVGGALALRYAPGPVKAFVGRVALGYGSRRAPPVAKRIAFSVLSPKHAYLVRKPYGSAVVYSRTPQPGWVKISGNTPLF